MSVPTAFSWAATHGGSLRQAGFSIWLLKNRTQSALFALRERLVGSGLAIDSIRYDSTPVASDKNGSAVADPLP